MINFNKYNNKDFYTLLIVALFFVTYFIIGLSIFRDYGISWDEPIQRTYGLDVYDYVLGNNQNLLKNKDRFYGPIFELILVTKEKGLNITDTQQIYYLRHLATFALFFAGAVFFYKLCSRRFRNPFFGLLGALFLITHPRIFAHSFYNSKDIPLLVLFVIATYTFYNFIHKPSLKNTILHALTSALLVNIRIVGILIPLLSLFFYFLVISSLIWQNRTNLKRRVFIYFKPVFIYVSVFILLTIFFWPTLWQNPYQNFRDAFEQMSKYPQSTSMWYFGQRIKSTDVPWHYTLGWIAVSTPFVILGSTVLGLLTTLYAHLRKRFNILDLFVGGWLVAPLLAVIYFDSVLYDEWRQMFFIYPALVYFAVLGVSEIFTVLKKIKFNNVIKYSLITLLVFELGYTGWFMIKNHPYQNLYLNNIGRFYRFEQDYWGLSYKEGLEIIARSDGRENIKVRVENKAGENALLILSPADRKRLTVKEKELDDADYYVTNFRKRPHAEIDLPVFRILSIQNNDYLGIYKLK
jgi:hypothetical protein